MNTDPSALGVLGSISTDDQLVSFSFSQQLKLISEVNKLWQIKPKVSAINIIQCHKMFKRLKNIKMSL